MWYSNLHDSTHQRDEDVDGGGGGGAAGVGLADGGDPVLVEAGHDRPAHGHHQVLVRALREERECGERMHALYNMVELIRVP